MSVIIVLILASLIVALIFLSAFVWSVRSGQYDDTLTPSMRMLLDDTAPSDFLKKTGETAAQFPVLKSKPERPTKHK